MTAPGVKPPSAAVRRRRAKVVELTRLGCWKDQVAAALGVTEDIVGDDRRVMRPYLNGVKKIVPRSVRPPDPAPYDWMAEPAQMPSWRAGSAVARIASLWASLLEGNARNQLAFSVAEARAAGDAEWYAGAQVQVAGLIGYLTQLLEVLQDPAAQQQAAAGGRDDLARVGRSAYSLPPRGAGAVPSRVYGEVWGYWWAGLPLDEEVVTRLAGRHASKDRVRRAVIEMEAAMRQQ